MDRKHRVWALGAAFLLSALVLGCAIFAPPSWTLSIGTTGLVGMAVTANQVIRMKEDCRLGLKIAGSTRLYEGTLVFVNSSGYADDDTGSGVNKFAGIAASDYDNSGGADGALSCELLADGVFLLTGSGFSQADVGKQAFATDNYTIAVADSASAVRIGVVVGYESATKLWVRLVTTQAFQATALTAPLTTITYAEPATPDYAIQNPTTTTPYGFVTSDEARSILKVIANLQTRSTEIEAILQSNGLVD